jgi:hypothetical protein
MQDEPNDRETTDLVAQLAALRHDEIEPERDLWPAIERRTRRVAGVRPWMQIAAALVIFILGIVAGRLTTARQAVERERPEFAVQREGSEFVNAIAAASRNGDERVRLKGREVALAALYGALYELDRAGDARLPDALRTVADHRDEAAKRVARVTSVHF